MDSPQQPQPEPVGEAGYALWQGGGVITNLLQDDQVFCQMNECIPEVVVAMRECIKESGSAMSHFATFMADDPAAASARGRSFLAQFGSLAEDCDHLADDYVAGGSAVTVVLRDDPLAAPLPSRLPRSRHQPDSTRIHCVCVLQDHAHLPAGHSWQHNEPRFLREEFVFQE